MCRKQMWNVDKSDAVVGAATAVAAAMITMQHTIQTLKMVKTSTHTEGELDARIITWHTRGLDQQKEEKNRTNEPNNNNNINKSQSCFERITAKMQHNSSIDR